MSLEWFLLVTFRKIGMLLTIFGTCLILTNVTRVKIMLSSINE